MTAAPHVVALYPLLFVACYASAAAPPNPATGSEEMSRNNPARNQRDPRAAYGQPASPEQADRVITIRPGRRFVNVTNGETVLFKVNGRAFAWRFTPTISHRTFRLEEIAPGDIDVRGVQVFCGPDLYERAG